MNHTNTIVDLGMTYFDLREQRDALDAKMAKIKARILSLAQPGKYKNVTVYKVKSNIIHVKSYTRRGFKAIRVSAV